MQRSYHGASTVQRTHNRSAAPAHRATRPSLKTDPFRCGATITIGESGGLCCPVSNLSQCLDATHGQPANTPLFAYTSGLPLTRPVITQQIQRALLEVGVPDACQYMSHSFHSDSLTPYERT